MKKRFTFTFAAIKNLRDYEQQQAAVALADQTARVLALEHEISETDRNRSAMVQSLNRAQVDIPERLSADWYGRYLDEQRHQSESALRAAGEDQERARQAYLAAHMRFDVFERLEQRQRERARAGELKNEYRNLDDTVTTRYAGQMSRAEGTEREVQ